MKAIRGVVLGLCTAMLFLIACPNAQADPWDKRTIVTFSEDVEIPGQVLPAGTYVFTIMNSTSYRHIVQIWTGDGVYLVATVVAIPSSRPEPEEESIFTFDERPSDSPVALKTWFYPGDTTGQEFVYSYRYPNRERYSSEDER